MIGLISRACRVLLTKDDTGLNMKFTAWLTLYCISITAMQPQLERLPNVDRGAVSEQITGDNEFVPGSIPSHWRPLYIELLKQRLDIPQFIPLYQTDVREESSYERITQNAHINIAEKFLKAMAVVDYLNIGYRSYDLEADANQYLGSLKAKILHTAITRTHPEIPAWAWKFGSEER